MIRPYLVAVSMVAVVAASASATAGTFESVGPAGFWHSPAAWILIEGSDEGGDDIPSEGDDVIVKAGHLIELHEHHKARNVLVAGNLRCSTFAAAFDLNHTFEYVTVQNGGQLQFSDGRDAEHVVTNITGDLTVEGGGLILGGTFTGPSQVTVNLGGNYTDLNTAGFGLRPGGISQWDFNFTGTNPAIMEMLPGASRDFLNVTVFPDKELTLESTSPVYLASGTATFRVRTGATLLLDNGAFFNGPGAFELEGGATLGVAAAHGIARSALFQNSGGATLPSNGNYLFNGMLGQQTGADLPTAVNSLTIDTPDWVTLSQNVNVSGDLVLKNGRLETGVHVVFAGENEEQIIRTNGYVDGNLARTFSAASTGNRLFPVGIETAYLPVRIDIPTPGTGFGFLTVSAVDEAFSGTLPYSTQPYYWTISGPAFSGYVANLHFGYSETTAPSPEEALRMIRHDGTGHSMPAGQSVDASQNLISVPGVTAFSDWIPVADTSGVPDWMVY